MTTTRVKVDQPTSAPTRKVTAATIGAAAGGALANMAVELSTQSPWLAWLAVADVQTLIYLAGSGLGAFLAGYMIRDTVKVPAPGAL